MAESPDFLHLNNQNSLHPGMKDVMGSSHAETRAESEARKRAEAEAEMARFAMRESPAPSEPPKKSSVLFAVLTVIFTLIALAGTGFGVFEYFQNDSLKRDYADLERDYIELKDEFSSLRDSYNALKSSSNKSSSNTKTSPNSSSDPEEE